MQTIADVASFFEVDAKELDFVVRRMSDSYRYQTWQLPKKGGGHRTIKSPCLRLRRLQRRLKDALDEVYPGRPAAHGFLAGHSIVTNAEQHLRKTFVFNVDLSGFFDSITTQRVRGLFMARPLEFPPEVAELLAQVACFQGHLPQGAPSSPVISNMIAWRLDAELQWLAKHGRATYTRYADDITFSFTCSRERLPHSLVQLNGGDVAPGSALLAAIQENGFDVNQSKVRLADQCMRMEVTGLTVNEFVNVRRRYVRQIGSMLHAWKKHGLSAAEAEYHTEYDSRHRASESTKSFERVVHGKLAFLLSVRGRRDPVFNRLAGRFNDLTTREGLKFEVFTSSAPEQVAIDSLWVLENDGQDAQGTGFMLKDVGLVTCAHVVADVKSKEHFRSLRAFRSSAPAGKYDLEVVHVDFHRDLAICQIVRKVGTALPGRVLELATRCAVRNDEVTLLGYPDYKVGHTPLVLDAKVVRDWHRSMVRWFEVGVSIRKGNSGGPVIDARGDVVGLVRQGASRDDGENAALCCSEIQKVLDSDEYSAAVEAQLAPEAVGE